MSNEFIQPTSRGAYSAKPSEADLDRAYADSNKAMDAVHRAERKKMRREVRELRALLGKIAELKLVADDADYDSEEEEENGWEGVRYSMQTEMEKMGEKLRRALR